jgi:hypothetical protein
MTMRFVTNDDVNPNLPVRSSRLPGVIRFVDGVYETDDRAEASVLRRSRFVTEVPVIADPGVSTSPVGLPPGVSSDEWAALGPDATSTASSGTIVPPAGLEDGPGAGGPPAE